VTTHRLPKPLVVFLAVTGFGAAWLAGRLVWEQTVLSWRHGPQMVGFTLTHAEMGTFLVLATASLLFMAALAVVVVLTVVALWRKQRVPMARWVLLATSVALLCVPSISYTTWQRLFVSRFVASAHAPDFITYAAAVGNLATVQAFLDRGVDVNARNRDGSTALHAAAVQGQVAVLRSLLEHGADPRIRNDFGHTALDDARSMKREEAVRLLMRHGKVPE
jgi:hypothetical protein